MDQFSPQDIKALIQSSAGQQLIAMLRQQDPGALAQASRLAKSGDYAGVQAALSSLVQNPNLQALLRQLGGGQNG